MSLAWKVILIFLVVAAVFFGVGCKSSKKAVRTGTPGGTAAPAAQQKAIMQSTEPEHFDPHRSNFEQDIALERMLFRGLYELQATSSGGVEVVPAMAAGDPTVSGDGLTYTVKLKSGLKWSDGTPLTADDFVFGIQTGCDPAFASSYSYLLQSVDAGGIIGVKGCDAFAAATGKTPDELQTLRAQVAVKAIDNTTLEITLVKPALLNTFKDIFSLWITFPLWRDVYQQFGDKWTDPGNIVVNGPFTLTEYVPQDHVTLVPNANWALDPKPKLQQLTIRFIDDYEAAFRSFQTGELDETRIPETDVPVAQGDSTLKNELLVVGSSRITSVEMQMKNAVIAKDNVRLALSKAIDRDTLVQAANSGVGLPAEYWLVKGLTGFQGRDKFKSEIGYDPDGAKKALADAGYANGQGFPTLTITILDSPARKAQAEFLQKAWKDILNISVDIKTVDAKTRSQLFNSENFELFISGWQLDYPDVENPIVGLFNSKPTKGTNNHYNCVDADIDAKIQQAGQATDPAQHIKLYQEAEDLVVSKLCGVIPMFQEAIPYVVSSKLGGVNANGTIDAAMPGNWCAECWFVKK